MDFVLVAEIKFSSNDPVTYNITNIESVMNPRSSCTGIVLHIYNVLSSGYLLFPFYLYFSLKVLFIETHLTVISCSFFLIYTSELRLFGKFRIFVIGRWSRGLHQA